ncbi:ABC transporter ATP-binding protein [Maribacter dokdonensis]|uniref:ABC transporter ATP-binding protein n=1 Tax=Maribacter dokdonensis TaxID=320912 RepID=UPI001C08E4C0|nr:ABC transporter ATP-binding protein [Maribacter dokdonensis]MBU2902975.1 ABC transporter ATP-binding protein [Maribacter dokdonensis]
MSIICELKKVSKTYAIGDHPTLALKDVSLIVNTGDFISIMGPSGCGKSTLLNLLALIDNPTTGAVKYEGQNVGTYKDKKLTGFRNKNIGIVFQNFNLIPVLSAIENVALVQQISGIDSKSAFNNAEKILKEVGLGNHLKSMPSNLSGGQQQRVAIARAFVNTPKVLVADEPTSSLDSKTSEAILELMTELNKTKKTAIIYSTHNLKMASYAERVINIKDGKIIN